VFNFVMIIFVVLLAGVCLFFAYRLHIVRTVIRNVVLVLYIHYCVDHRGNFSLYPISVDASIPLKPNVDIRVYPIVSTGTIGKSVFKFITRYSLAVEDVVGSSIQCYDIRSSKERVLEILPDIVRLT
jgi:hypothetical protein